MRSIRFALSLLTLLALFLSACAASPQTTEVVTVIETVPVEITRLVEVPRTVEVTRLVIQTAIVEVVATQTAITTVDILPTPTAAVTWVYVPSNTPLSSAPTNYVKVKGTSLLKITNQTNDVLKVELFGDDPLAVNIDPGKSVFHVLREGKYTYKVQRDNKRLYSGTISINNPDKHELLLNENKATIILP